MQCRELDLVYSESPCTHSAIISALMTNFAHIFSSVYAALMVNTQMASNWPVIPKKNPECKTDFIISCSTSTIKSNLSTIRVIV